MPTYLRIGMEHSVPHRSKLILATVILLSSCSSPPLRPVSIPAPPPPPVPYRVCAPDEDPRLTGCRKETPTSAITIRGVRE